MSNLIISGILIRKCIWANDISNVARVRIENDYIPTKQQLNLIKYEPGVQTKTSFDEIQMLNKKRNTIYDMMMAIDYKTYLADDVLHKVDRATMSVSLEGREPLLDHRLIEYVAQIPSHLKIKNGDKKYLLKNIVHQYVPKKMMDRPKTGFGIPFDKWFSNDKNELFNYFLSDAVIKKQGVLNLEEVHCIKAHYNRRKSPLTQAKLWNIFILNQWIEEWL